MVGHAGARLLADPADATGLSGRFAEALLADGGQAIADLAVLRGQGELYEQVASEATAWRVLAGIDEQALTQLRVARAAAREVAWLQRCETRGRLAAAMAADRELPGLVLDTHASIVVCHSSKQQAQATWTRTFGYHPMFCFLDNTGEALAGLLRPGNAGSNTTADHITVLDQALAQIPDAHRYGTPVLIRADTAGNSAGLLVPTSAACAATASRPASQSEYPSPNRSGKPSPPTRPGNRG